MHCDACSDIISVQGEGESVVVVKVADNQISGAKTTSPECEYSSERKLPQHMNVKEYKTTTPGCEYSSERKPTHYMNVKEFKTTSPGCEYSSERI